MFCLGEQKKKKKQDKREKHRRQVSVPRIPYNYNLLLTLFFFFFSFNSGEVIKYYIETQDSFLRSDIPGERYIYIYILRIIAYVKHQPRSTGGRRALSYYGVRYIFGFFFFFFFFLYYSRAGPGMFFFFLSIISAVRGGSVL